MTLAKDGASAAPPRKSVGVRDVARHAEVSLGTVSNVINNPDLVAQATRARVESVMTELGFVPSRAAGQLRSRRSSLVGVVVPDVGNPYWASVLRGIETVLGKSGLAIIVGSTHQDPERQRQLLLGLAGQRVDGLIVAPIDDQHDWQQFFEHRYGIIALESNRSRSVPRWVSLDHVEGANLAASHLIDLGHRNIAFINGPRFVSWCAERHEGIVKSFRQRGLSPEQNLLEIEVSDLTVNEGARATEALLADHSPTAIMCANDLVALGVLLALNRRGVRVPHDISLVGYDDADFAPALRPALTTVSQPSSEMGVAAARLLVKGAGRPKAEHVQFVPELVVRESTTPPAGR